MNFIRTLAILAAISLTGCATGPTRNPADPFEPFNRSMYTFNDTVDKVIAKPVAQGYNAVLPEFVRSMVTNFFSNLDDVIVTANDLLQFKITQGISDGARVLVNSTIGVGGLIDVASARLEKHNEDFGQTLGYWGMESGPYLVLPFLGSSSIRDGIGTFGDGQVSVISRTRHVRSRNQMFLTKAINRRALLLTQEKVLEGAMIDRYSFLRDAYLQRRLNLVYDDNPPHDKLEDEDTDFEYQPDAPASPAPEPAKPQTSAPVAPAVTDAAPAYDAAPVEPTGSAAEDAVIAAEDAVIAPLTAASESQADEPPQFDQNQQPVVYKVWLAQH